MHRSQTWLGMIRALRSFWSGSSASRKSIAGPSNSERHDGAFLCVRLGDLFDDQRYSVLRKLGCGQYSTVWLARDDKLKTHVALKILRSDCYGGPHDIFELEILQHINEIAQKSTHGGKRHISRLLNHFEHIGCQGKHVCMAFDPLGQHLGFQIAQYRQGRLPVRFVREIIRQTLSALDFLHSECNVIHTDLQPSNILLELEDPEAVVTEYLRKTTPRLKNGSEGHDASPLREVLPSSPALEQSKVKIKLADFGVASWRHRHLGEVIQPPHLRAPEVTLGAPWDTAVDIWSLGCLTIELTKGHIAFRGEAAKSGAWSEEDDRLAQIMEVFGPFPRSLLERGSKTSKFFDSEGNLLRIPILKPTTLEALMDGNHEVTRRPDEMSREDVLVFVDFLNGMLALDPLMRKSAEELLQHPWLRTANAS